MQYECINQSEVDSRPERIGERTNKAWKEQTQGFYYTVVDAMLKTGFKEDEIMKIGGENFFQVFDEVMINH